jgi:hypothetical protein
MLLPLLVVLACPPESRVTVAPEQWAKARPADHDAWLAQLHLRPASDTQWGPTFIESVQVLRGRFTGSAPADRLVIAVLTAALKEERELLSREVVLYRIQLLRPDGAAWCAVDGSLSEDAFTDTYAAGPVEPRYHRARQKFSLEVFTRADRDALHVENTVELTSRIQSTTTEHTWLELRDDVITPVGHAKTGTATCMICDDDERYTRWTFELRAKLPKQVVQYTATSAQPVDP